ncbi:hypothetical protein DL96DRAFT_1630226 [Flagelloscypha sp. PMI_526]|nr:hypothetical protein DL96DRAFT_1630226 [Flagelloscypha sp. PMI_526]
MSLYSTAQLFLQRSRIPSILSSLYNDTPEPLVLINPEFEAQKRLLAGLLNILPSELVRVILSHCDLGTLLACCLTTRRLLDDSRPRLYRSIQLQDRNVETFVDNASHHVHFVRHLSVSVCPVAVGAPWAGYYEARVKGTHDESWLRLIDELKATNKLESFNMASSLDTTSFITPTLESAFLQLRKIQSLKKVKTNLVISSNAIPPRVLDWGALLKGVRICSTTGGFGETGELINLTKNPSTIESVNIPVLKYVEVERLVNPWSVLQQYFNVYHVRCLSLRLKGWSPKDGHLLEDVLASVAASLEVLSVGWIELDRELEEQLLNSDISLISLRTLNLVVTVDENAKVLSSRVLPYLHNTSHRCPKLHHLQIMFASSFTTQFDEHLSNSLVSWTTFGSFVFGQPSLLTLDVLFAQMGSQEEVGAERTLTRKRLINDIFGLPEREGRLRVTWHVKGMLWPFFG